ncbi:MAG: hypothetical protein HOK84_12310, partial [Bacteroidetes bacterium]|nr:hypothetical protein [Bacteroidota bacterium]
GSINISIKSPDGEEYQSLDISPSADIRWNQRLKLKADEEKSKAGKWTISIDAEEVKGTCSVRMRSK